jgi:hypothetical protein
MEVVLFCLIIFSLGRQPNILQDICFFKVAPAKGLEKMWIVTLPNGVELDVSGGLRVLEIENGFYVVGQEMLISVNSQEEGLEEIRKLKENEC